MAKFWKPGTMAPGSETSRSTYTHEDEIDFLLNTSYSARTLSSHKTLDQLRLSLPVYQYKRNLLYLIENEDVIILRGQTGSGKSTQIPQYLHEADWTGVLNNGLSKMIAVTQPRKVAAVSLAQRVSQETGTLVGDLVGYSVRFEEKCSAVTRIKYLTDGMLFRELLFDPLLNRYSIVMVDEAHERTIYTDLLLGLLRRIALRRRDSPDPLKIIISSATINSQIFVDFFKEKSFKVGVLDIPGRQYPIEIFYLDKSADEYVDYIEEASQTVLKIHYNETEVGGDILVFLPGKEEIEKCAAMIQASSSSIEGLSLLKLHASLSLEEQSKVFTPPPRGIRRCILATNVAETSITIDGILFVIDCGKVKQRVFDPMNGLNSLILTPVSRASADQRAGRAGRVKAGKVYRLYSEDEYQSFIPETIPEIQKSNLSQVILQMMSLGVHNIQSLGLPSLIPTDSLAYALEYLYSLDAVNDKGQLTAVVGLPLSELPLEPSLGRMLLSSAQFNCTDEILCLISMLSAASSPFIPYPPNQRTTFEAAQRKLSVEEGDLISLINIFRSFQLNAKSSKWCNRNFLNHSTLLKAQTIYNHLAQYARKYNLDPTKSTNHVDQVLRCIIKGLFHNAAIARSDGSYYLVPDGQSTLYIHPSSVLFRRVPRCVVFREVMEVGEKVYMRDITPVEVDWLSEGAPNYYE